MSTVVLIDDHDIVRFGCRRVDNFTRQVVVGAAVGQATFAAAPGGWSLSRRQF